MINTTLENEIMEMIENQDPDQVIEMVAACFLKVHESNALRGLPNSTNKYGVIAEKLLKLAVDQRQFDHAMRQAVREIVEDSINKKKGRM